MALMILLHDWILRRKGTLHAITIDHQLRAESGEEASRVNQWCEERSIPHTTLVWKKDQPPSRAVHQYARAARYELLCNACGQLDLPYLFLGHHADDQAETVLMRLLKGSGIDGLAGMPRTRTHNGITLVRPLLPVTKLSLIHTCLAHHQPYCCDPSNDSPAYLRGRLRKLAAPLAREGLTTATLFEIARHAGMARNALESVTNAWVLKHATTHPLGIIQLDGHAWKTMENVQQRRILIRVLLCMSGNDYPPRNTSLDLLTQSLMRQKTLHQTLCGCHIILRSGLITFYREVDATPQRQKFQPHTLWDNRFKLHLDESLLDKNLTIAPLGTISRDALKKMGHPRVADCPALHRATLPALYLNNQLHSIPDFARDEPSSRESQALAKAIFLPKRMVVMDCFDVCSALADVTHNDDAV